jgi:Cellulose biosynthesis protein BcsS
MPRVRRYRARLIWGALAVFAATAGCWTSCRADDGAVNAAQHFEVWTGAQAYDQVWSLYSGVTMAPFGSVQEDGVRLRLVAGYGADRYSGPRAIGAGSHIVTFNGMGSFAEALGGYQQQLGSLTVKVFAGITAADRQIRPADPETAIHGAGLGGKAALETWWNLGDAAWTSVDLSWGSLYQSYAARARLGWRFTPALSAGLEAGAAGNIECDIIRLGAFVRYELASGEISLSGGAANDKLLHNGNGGLLSAAQAGAPFAIVSWLTRF